MSTIPLQIYSNCNEICKPKLTIQEGILWAPLHKSAHEAGNGIIPAGTNPVPVSCPNQNRLVGQIKNYIKAEGRGYDIPVISPPRQRTLEFGNIN